MPTIAEIRQKYPQYNDMSDDALAGALHKKFYSDIPVQDFNAKIGLASPAPAVEQGFERATILPFGKDKATGEISMAVPGLLKGLYESGVQAVTAPGRAMSGELQVMGPNGVTPEAIQEGLNFAGWASPASPASGLAKAAVKVPPQPAPLGEGQQAALAAQRLGVDLPRAAASDRTAVQQMGKALTNIPIGGTPLRKASETALGQLDDAAMRVQQGFGSGDVAKAGALARQGVKDYSANTLDDLVSKKYDVVDDLINPDITAPLSATKARVNSLLASRQSAALPSEGSAAAIVKQAIERPEGLTYHGAKRLRTEVGQMLKNPQMAPQGTSNDELKALYGSLSEDLGNIVKAADLGKTTTKLSRDAIAQRDMGVNYGMLTSMQKARVDNELRSAISKPAANKAYEAFKEANTFAAKTIEEQKVLDKIIGPQSDEGLFSSIQAMAGSNSRANLQSLMRVRKAVSPETWNEISSAVISKMGRDADGNFTPDRFLTAYGKLSENGKTLLFRGGGKKELASSLDDIATVSRRFKQLNQFANPSGTAQNLIGGAIPLGLWVEPTSLISSVASSRVLSSVMAKPTSAKKLAEWAKAYEKAVATPTPANSNMLGVRAKVLALAVANDAGNPGLFNSLVAPLSIPQKVKAGPENGPGLMELPQDGDSQNPRMLLPNEL